MSKHTVDAGIDDFEDIVLNSDIPVIVDFWAAWCGPCRQMAPMLEGYAQEYEGKVKVVKVDVDAHPDLSSRYNVRGIPTLIGFSGGKDVAELVGLDPGGISHLFKDMATGSTDD